jgi:hypothetical protein
MLTTAKHPSEDSVVWQFDFQSVALATMVTRLAGWIMQYAFHLPADIGG